MHLERNLDLERSRYNYARVASFYDFWGWLTERKAAQLVFELAAFRPADRVLDIACGTGQFLVKILDRVTDGYVLGVDLSEDMLARAQKRLAAFPAERLELRIANVLELEADANGDGFDVLINNFMVDLMPETEFEHLAQIYHNLLKPGGRLAMATFAAGHSQLNHLWGRVAARWPDLLAGCRPVAFVPYLEKAGFTIRQVTDVSQNTFPAQVILAVKY